jgi:hypothetical protein
MVSNRFNSNTNDIIFQIVSDKQGLNSQKGCLVDADPTKGSQDILITRLHPFQAIDMIRRRAVSKNYTSSSYVFFENKRGFNFVTLEFLMSDQRLFINDKQFWLDTAQLTDIGNMNTRSIITLINQTQVNNTKKIASGSLNNITNRFDLLTGKITSTNYVDAEQRMNFKYADENPKGLNTSTFENMYGTQPAASMLVPHSSDLPENYIDASIGFRNSYISKLNQNKYLASVNGDTALTAGDVITVTIPSASGDTDLSDKDRNLSGNYMMSKVRHTIMNYKNQQKSFLTSLELIKGSYNNDN